MIIILIIISFISNKFKYASGRMLLILSLAMLICVPYLIYTYSLSGKIFYWANSGGLSLYTMSSPYSTDLGNWKKISFLSKDPNHAEFMNQIKKLSPVERDNALKQRAIENIANYPVKFLCNWVANVGRMLFSYPWPGEQTIKTYFTLLPNMFVVVFIVCAIALSIGTHRKLPKEILLLFWFISIYLLGSSLLSAYRRMFLITIPFWNIFICYVFTNTVSIKIRQ